MAGLKSAGFGQDLARSYGVPEAAKWAHVKLMQNAGNAYAPFFSVRSAASKAVLT